MTSIEWTDKTWNPVRGCSRVSEGCRHCYAEEIAARFSGEGQAYEGLAQRVGGEPRWTGAVRFLPEKLAAPLRWRKPRRVFVCPQHTFQVLTKRPERAVGWFRWLEAHHAEQNATHGPVESLSAETRIFALRQRVDLFALAAHAVPPWPLPNVELGVSVEDQATADERIPELLRCPAAMRWVSYEPALGPVDFDGNLRTWRCPECGETPSVDGRWRWLDDRPEHHHGYPIGHLPASDHGGLDWIVVGGESGPKARPFDIAWGRETVAQCRAAGVPVFVKQLGARPQSRDFEDLPGREQRRLADDVGEGACHGHFWRSLNLRHPKGGDPAEWPEDLRVREWPAVPSGAGGAS